ERLHQRRVHPPGRRYTSRPSLSEARRGRYRSPRGGPLLERVGRAMWRRRCFEAASGASLRAFRGPFSCEVSGLFEKNRRIGRKTKKGLARSEVGPLYAPSSTGSSTSLPTECGRSSGVEHHLAKVR